MVKRNVTIALSAAVAISVIAAFVFVPSFAVAITSLTSLTTKAPTGTNEQTKVQDTVSAEVHRGRTLENVAAGVVNYASHVVVTAVHPNGAEFYHWEGHNLLVDAGKNFARTQLGSTSPGSNGANYVALSTNSKAPAASDVCLSTTDGGSTSAEIEDANGLARVQGTYATGATGVYTVAKTFTATGAYTNVQKSALLDAARNGDACAGSNDGTLFAAATFTAVTLATNDQLTVTWTITIS